MIKVHATCVEWGGGAVVLRGPPGSGKSDLGLRLIDGGGRLVADDQVRLDVIKGSVVAGAPPSIAGKIEVRGLGVIDLPEESIRARANVVLIADLVAGGTLLTLGILAFLKGRSHRNPKDEPPS